MANETKDGAWAQSTQKEKKKKKNSKHTLLKVIIWLAVIALIIFLTLFIAAKVGQFESIPALIQYIRNQINM